MSKHNYVHYGDLLAIPCFLIAFLYFYKKPKRTLIEDFLLFFTFSGFLFDSVSTFIYFKRL